MTWLIQRLRVPANERQMGVTLAMCAVAMSLMLWAILWESEIISRQAELIRWLKDVHIGGLIFSPLRARQPPPVDPNVFPPPALPLSGLKADQTTNTHKA